MRYAPPSVHTTSLRCLQYQPDHLVTDRFCAPYHPAHNSTTDKASQLFLVPLKRHLHGVPNCVPGEYIVSQRWVTIDQPPKLKPLRTYLDLVVFYGGYGERASNNQNAYIRFGDAG